MRGVEAQSVDVVLVYPVQGVFQKKMPRVAAMFVVKVDGVREKLKCLQDLGITAVELLPVADFPGNRNWGYDGVDLFAPARCYGTPDELRHLVNEAHALNIGVFLDVVYNHLGPEGAYLGAFSPYYFSSRHGVHTESDLPF